MGIAFTPETLKIIKNKNVGIKDKKEINDNSNSLSDQNLNKRDIFYNIFSPIYLKQVKKSSNQKKELLLGRSLNSEKNINENKKSDNKGNTSNEINNIINKNYKSFDLFYKNILLDNDDKEEMNNKKEALSEKSENSDYSDYIDISKEYSLFNLNIMNENENKNKTGRKIRNSYYNKLITNNYWNPLKKEKTFNNIFIFDWDDTLLCTSYLLPTGALNDMEINKKDKEIIANLDILVYKLLAKTMKLGLVFIITNGAPGWVELSSVKFYPKSARLMKNIKIISARGLCEKKLPGDARQWKSITFKYALEQLKIKKNIPTNIIAFGDSIIEIEASYNLKESFLNAYLKTIKFKETPTHIELEKELKIIITQIDSILCNFKNLSIRVTRKKNE